MRKFFHTVFFTLFVTVFSYSIVWYIDDTKEVAYAKPLFVIAEGAVPLVTAPSWILFDIDTGEILAGKDSEHILPIASVTKLMTALITKTEQNLEATTSISKEAVNTYGRAGRLEEGEIMHRRELLFPLLLESSNDAAEVLAESDGDRKLFVSKMNARAKDLGMHATTFEDPSGLSPNNLSSAQDLSVLLGHLYKKERHLLDITTLPQYVGLQHDWMNNDPVVGEGGYEGGKHGFTPEAGRTYAGVFTETLVGGMKRPMGIVVLDSKNIKTDVSVLRDFVRNQIAYTSR